ncbi:hypothetical protein CAEBREN_05264 [Caenorhabditis brenneri]|uniref:Transcription factor CEP-1 DNA-binding domain-containing protein n=1 Tax=Caenorhabditis brenneri TaxID=135651 RepID=G0NLL7_CAEBE|nr:hypothetical protein CAEBREN_05264 [Caenorhabditis brenneri]
MRAVLHDILLAEKGEEDDSSSSTSSFFGPARQTGLKRRTQRILDVEIVNAEAKVDVRPKAEEKFLMDISVIEARASKKSDLAYKDFGENKILWTKPKCKVPVVVQWKSHSLVNNRDLSLRIRLVNYLKKHEMENAIRDPAANVLKCQNHIDEELRMPRESFFYVVHSTVPWVCSVENLNYPRGFEYSTRIKAGINEVNFDIMFMCQKNCMIIEDKRKTMCLAAFLEDENGNEISFSVIEEVHIHGYPQRDCKNFCGKLPTFHFPEKSSSFKPPMNITTTPGIDRQAAPSSSLFTTHRPFDNTFRMTNSNRMIPSTSNPRKRGASEHVQMHDHTRLPSKSTEYIMKLYGCVPASEPMDYQHDPNENKNQQSTSAKRTRPSYFPQKTLQV